MDNLEMTTLKKMELAPWIQKATALIEQHRKVGGNQFRHCLATMTILLDYHFVDSILLKTSIVHDLLEDSEKVTKEELAAIDSDGPAVVKLVLELTRYRQLQSKQEYFANLLNNGSPKSMIVKLADRISNMTDLHLFVYSEDKAEAYIRQTEQFILPMVDKLQQAEIPADQKSMILEMGKELKDLISIRRMYVKEFLRDESIRIKIMKKLKALTQKNRSLD